jgi:ParB family chromosome partitioning protein
MTLPLNTELKAIPLDKLRLSQANVRRIKDGVSIEDLARSIARHGLLQSLNVRPELGADGTETGRYEVPIGGRRFEALKLLVKQKKLKKNAPIPCLIKRDGHAEADSLAENTDRVQLHPLDEFRAFLALHQKGVPEEDIAAAFGVSALVVRQRLRLASASPTLLAAYEHGEITLEKLMAFSVTADHARQEQVYEILTRQPYLTAYAIKTKLTETTVPSTDKRVRFVGLDAYEAAGGKVTRDLFAEEGTVYLDDPTLLNGLADGKLKEAAAKLLDDGWKWAVTAIDYNYSLVAGLGRIHAISELTAAEETELAALREECDAIDAAHADDADLAEDVAARIDELELRIEGLEAKASVYAADAKVRAGCVLTLDHTGKIRIEYGLVKPEDDIHDHTPDDISHESAAPIADATPAVPGMSDEERDEDTLSKPLSDRLITELTCLKTLALRHLLANDWELAQIALLHNFCLNLFYRQPYHSCLTIDLTEGNVEHIIPGLDALPFASEREAQRARWQKNLPEKPQHLWSALCELDSDSRQALLAFCVSTSLYLVTESWNRYNRSTALTPALADALGLDLTAMGWRPTAENYLGRVTKANILAAVADAKGDDTAELLAPLKKSEMVAEAERLLKDTGWLPELLRARRSQALAPSAEDTALPAFLDEAA